MLLLQNDYQTKVVNVYQELNLTVPSLGELLTMIESDAIEVGQIQSCDKAANVMLTQLALIRKSVSNHQMGLSQVKMPNSLVRANISEESLAKCLESVDETHEKLFRVLSKFLKDECKSLLDEFRSIIGVDIEELSNKIMIIKTKEKKTKTITRRVERIKGIEVLFINDP